jgi:hypothetical protein
MALAQSGVGYLLVQVVKPHIRLHFRLPGAWWAALYPSRLNQSVVMESRLTSYASLALLELRDWWPTW